MSHRRAWNNAERARPLLLSALLLLGTLVTGAAMRFAPLRLPPFLVKYGGSTLWALLIYWLLTTVCSQWRIVVAAASAALITAGIEFLKLYHAPSLDAFRLTLPGILLLGRYFAWWDIVAYWIAIAMGAVVDTRLRPSHPPL